MRLGYSKNKIFNSKFSGTYPGGPTYSNESYLLAISQESRNVKGSGLMREKWLASGGVQEKFSMFSFKSDESS